MNVVNTIEKVIRKFSAVTDNCTVTMIEGNLGSFKIILQNLDTQHKEIGWFGKYQYRYDNFCDAINYIMQLIGIDNTRAILNSIEVTFRLKFRWEKVSGEKYNFDTDVQRIEEMWNKHHKELEWQSLSDIEQMKYYNKNVWRLHRNINKVYL
jgi:hypothetical protein